MLRKLISFSTFILLSVALVGCFPSKNNDVPNDGKGNSSKVENNSDSDKNDSREKENNKNDSDDKSSQISNTKPVNVVDASDLDNTTVSWYFKPNTENKVPEVNTNLKFDLKDYGAIYTGPTNKESKSLYLTFDEGYENGYTPKILDVLKAKNVKAVFFVTSPYVKDNPDLIKRMVDEGHIVGNHSNHHPSMPDKATDINIFNDEFTDVETKYKEVTGKEMVKLFRPPMGKYSQKSLAMTNNLGYKSVFWSFAYHDWDPKEQPSSEAAKKKLMNHLHDGSILLLHAVSKTNTEILGEFIDSARGSGYEFKLLK